MSTHQQLFQQTHKVSNLMYNKGMQENTSVIHLTYFLVSFGESKRHDIMGMFGHLGEILPITNFSSSNHSFI